MDPISDMLIRIKNAGRAGKKTASLPFSRIKYDILKILEKQNLIVDVEKKGKRTPKTIELSLIYGDDGKPIFSNIKRISKPGRRVYRGFKEINKVKNGVGIGIYSTSKGLLTDRDARKEKVGGEILFEVWK